MTFEVRTRVYEGPLDLLLQLITSHQLAITELSLVEMSRLELPQDRVPSVAALFRHAHDSSPARSRSTRGFC